MPKQSKMAQVVWTCKCKSLTRAIAGCGGLSHCKTLCAVQWIGVAVIIGTY